MTRPFPLDAEQERFVADILSYMTLEEKLGQLAVLAPAGPDTAFTDAVAAGRIGGVAGIADRDSARAFQRLAVEQTRLGIPLIFAAAPAPGTAAAPSGWSRAASWDLSAIERLGRDAAEDTLARGARWLLGPGVVLDHRGLSGDAAICAAEPELLAALTAAYVRGVRDGALADRPGVLAGLQCRHADPATVGESDPAMLATVLAAIGEDCLASVEPLPPALARFAGIALESCARILDHAGGTDQWTVEAAQAAIADGRLSEGAIEDAARGVLSVKSALGLFRDPYAGLAPDPDAAATAGLAVVRQDESELELARRAMVLLRNRGAILPLSQDLQRILVIGEPAGIAQGCRDGLETFGISTRSLPGLALREEGESYLDMTGHDPFAIALACDAARRSDVVLLALDEPMFTRAPGRLARPSAPILTLIQALAGTGTPIVGISACGDPVDLGPAADAFSAIVLAWHAGLATPVALAELLSGEFSPCGRLPVALASETEAARFPFGHGLGYGETVFSEFTLEAGESAVGAGIRLHNPSEFEVIETVQLYAGLAGAQEQRLAAFERVRLDPGEARNLQFELGARELGLPGADGRYRIAGGVYQIAIGKSAQRVLARELEIEERYAKAIMHGRPVRAPARATGTFGER